MSNERMKREQRHRLFQSVFLVAALLLLTGRAAGLLFGPVFAVLVLVVAALAGVTTLKRQRTVLPTGSREITRREAPDLFAILGALADRAGLERAPVLVYVPSPVPNAAATIQGRRELIVVTEGLLRRLGRRELTGVLAHEVSHIRNGDLPLFAVVAALQGVVRLLANATLFGMVLFFPLILLGAASIPFSSVLFLMIVSVLAGLIQMAILRTREFQADLSAAELTGDPAGLASALRRLDVRALSLLDWFVGTRRRSVSPVFRTHPETEERVERLLSLESPHSGYGNVTV